MRWPSPAFFRGCFLWAGSGGAAGLGAERHQQQAANRFRFADLGHCQVEMCDCAVGSDTDVLSNDFRALPDALS